METMSPRLALNPGWAGAVLGSAIGGVCLLVEVLAFGSWVMVIAVGVGGLLGWVEGPRVAQTRRFGRSIIRMSILAVLLGDVTVSLMLVGPDGGGAPNVIGVGFLGLAIFGLPALALTTAASGVWAVTFRWWLARAHQPSPEP